MPYCLLYSEDVLYLIGTELQQNVQPDIHSSRKYDQRSLGDGGNNKTEVHPCYRSNQKWLCY